MVALQHTVKSCRNGSLRSDTSTPSPFLSGLREKKKCGGDRRGEQVRERQNNRRSKAICEHAEALRRLVSTFGRVKAVEDCFRTNCTAPSDCKLFLLLRPPESSGADNDDIMSREQQGWEQQHTYRKGLHLYLTGILEHLRNRHSEVRFLLFVPWVPALRLKITHRRRGQAELRLGLGCNCLAI